MAASKSPSLRIVRCGVPAKNSAALAAKPALDCCDVGWAAHSTTSFFRACCTIHQFLPMMATPGMSPCRFVVPSTTNACVTPGIALIASRFALATLAANTGLFTNVA